jgi:ABC-type lipoprotein export system ATPase subunit
VSPSTASGLDAEGLAPARPLAACSGVTVAYGQGEARVVALADAEVEIGNGEIVSLAGVSGSGKTTLLHVLGGLVVPSAGTVTWKGEPLSSLDAAARGRARAAGIAYVFQGSNLIPHLSVWENLAFAALITTSRREISGPEPEHALALVGLRGKADSLPAELSGGEQQRVAIARAVIQMPELLLCDEPTGHLDSDTGRRVLDMLVALQGESGFSLVIATHDESVAARGDRRLELAEGRLVASAA